MQTSGKTIVGVFAHPDDEAFGPGGTLATFAKQNDVYIICATSGEYANGVLDVALGRERREELMRSSKVLGVKDVFFLDYQDGSLSNDKYHDIAKKIEDVLLKLKPNTLITFEPHGVSGHLDHIAISMITQFVFSKIPSAQMLLLYALPIERTRMMSGKYFIFFPEGYAKEEIDATFDVTDVWDTKVRAMMEHKSQIHDVERILDQAKHFPKEEYYLVKTK